MDRPHKYGVGRIHGELELQVAGAGGRAEGLEEVCPLAWAWQHATGEKTRTVAVAETTGKPRNNHCQGGKLDGPNLVVTKLVLRKRIK